MSSAEEEYEIESILEARVEKKKKSREPTLIWKFRVRWKGYSADDDTWEPIENLTGSEESLKLFWERAYTGGRDWRIVNIFRPGESFFPVGPPKKQRHEDDEADEEEADTRAAKGKVGDKKPRTIVYRKSGESAVAQKRARSSTTDREQTPQKRSRPAPVSFNSKPTHLLSGPIASPKEVDLPTSPGTGSSSTSSNRYPPANNTDTEDSLQKETRQRTGNGNRVMKLLSDHHSTNYQANPNPASSTNLKKSSSAKRPKPGPGRSSAGLLLESSTSKATKSSKPPKTDMLFDSQQCGIDDRNKPAPSPKQKKPLHSTSVPTVASTTINPVAQLEIAQDYDYMQMLLPRSPMKESLPPSIQPSPNVSSLWKRSTIFGPLGLGVYETHSDAKDTDSGSPTPFQLTLDALVSIPVLLVGENTPSVMTQGGPPGKFYRRLHAIDLLATLRPKGSSLSVSLSPQANPDHTKNFAHFARRLYEDELFLAMVGKDLLVFCSSSNELSQRLNLLPNIPQESIIASHVSIEDYSAFADATANADNSVWSQYTLTVEEL